MPEPVPTILLDSFSQKGFGKSWRFYGYTETVVAMEPEQVQEVLARAEDATAEGLYAIGFVAYEAASALNRHLISLPSQTDLPLVWFALFRERKAVQAGNGLPCGMGEPPCLSPECGEYDHANAVSRIHDAIESGETYQINHTFQLEGDFTGDPLIFYRDLLHSQCPAFGAYIDTGRHLIISASPELFFSLKDGVITTCPMKGTASRGRFPEEDAAIADSLRNSEKERAENLMIVDLLRNDIGRIAETGSVDTEKLFQVEQYPTVHQMTSTISARVNENAGITDIFRALFPCGSVTGAPKKRSMEIINKLEQSPRGIYCGAIGFMAPDQEALFSVAIRSLLHDRKDGRIRMGVGSGVTWCSDPAQEYAECLTKAGFVYKESMPPLLESLLLEDGSYPLLERHLSRLAWSASRIGHCCSIENARSALLGHAKEYTGRRKVRLLLSQDGSITVESLPLVEMPEPLKLAISTDVVDPQDLTLYLKTAARDRYDAARKYCPGADEVLFVNNRGELTEGSFNNLVLLLDGRYLTPPLSSGLLPGVMRAELLENLKIEEALIFPPDLDKASEIWMINSVRGWQRGQMMKGAGS